MRLSWFGFIQQPLTQDPADPGAGGHDPSAHPEYDIEFDAGDGNDDPSRQPGAPAGRAPVQPATSGGTPPPGGGPDPSTQPVTPEQFERVTQAVTRLESQLHTTNAENQILKRQIAALTGVQPPAQPAAADQPQLSEADQKAVAYVFKILPGLKNLLDAAPKLLGLPDTVQGFQTESEQRWQALGTRMWAAFDAEIGKVYGGRALHATSRQFIDAAFLHWLETDKQAAARYNVGDTSLVADFVQLYKAGVITPATAPTPSTTQPGRSPLGRPAQARVPRGGPGTSTVGHRPEQPNPKDPQQVHDGAADAFFANR